MAPLGERINTLLRSVVRPVMARAKKKAVHSTANTNSDWCRDVTTDSNDNLAERAMRAKSSHGVEGHCDEDDEDAHVFASASSQSGKAKPRVSSYTTTRSAADSDRINKEARSPNAATIVPVTPASEAPESGPDVPKLGKASTRDGIISGHACGMKRSHRDSEDNHLTNPSSKRRQSSRSQYAGVLSFDVSHRPLDAYTRSKAVAKKKSKPPAEISELNDSDSNEDDDSTVHMPGLTVSPILDDSPEENCIAPPSIHGRTSSASLEGGLRKSARRSILTDNPSLYDMSWHPADTVIRPQAAAWRKRNGLGTSSSVAKFTGSTDTNPSTVVFNSAQHKETVLVSSDEEGARVQDREIEVAPSKPEISLMASKLDAEGYDVARPHLRRSSRAQASTHQPLYDARVHPADIVLRPARTANHTSSCTSAVSIPPPKHQTGEGISKKSSRALGKLDSKSTDAPARFLNKSSLTEKSNPNNAHDDINLPSSNSLPKPPNWSRGQNPYVNTRVLGWDRLQEMDKYVYSIQRGAPLNGNTLPLSWQKVKKRLYVEGYITLDELRGDEATRWLKAQYEGVRLGLQAFFKAKPEAMDKKEWTVFHVEGFDIYDKERGRKYWRHFEDSIVQPTTTTSAVPRIHQALETENRRGEEKPTISIGILGEMGPSEHVEPRHSVPDRSLARSTINFARPYQTGIIGDGHADGWDPDETDITLPKKLRKTTRPIKAGENKPQEAIYVVQDSFEDWLNGPTETLQEGDTVSEDASSAPESTLNTHPPVVILRRPEHARSGFDAALDGSSHRRGFDAAQLTGVATVKRNFSAPIIQARDIAERQGEIIVCPNRAVGEHEPEPLMPSLPILKSRKRKFRSKVSDPIYIHEDQPGETPKIRKIIVKNPVSPGIDIAKENLSSQELSGVSSTETPRSSRRRVGSSTPLGARIVYDGAIGPYRTMFGGD
ncbi:MAG: hypothetical protein Q9217_002400 [Psora testacea]